MTTFETITMNTYGSKNITHTFPQVELFIKSCNMFKMQYAKYLNSEIYTYTVCPGSSDPSYLVTYYIKWVTTSWT